MESSSDGGEKPERSTWERLVGVVGELKGINDAEELSRMNPDSSLDADLKFDSLDTVEAVMAVEEHFGIEIDQNRLEGIKTLGQVHDLVEEHLGSAGS